jgi:hypothetical protein
MRLPDNPENWTIWHAEKAIAKARKEFAKYEAKIDFAEPKEQQEDLYFPYRLARQEACLVAQAVQVNDLINEAESLP